MKRFLILILILLTACIVSCRPSPQPPVEAAPAPAAAAPAPVAAPSPAPPDPLTQTVWTREDQPDLPGGMRIFLPNGTLVMDSCWETYRLVSWQKTGGQSLRWNEDGKDIEAEIVSLSPQELTLQLKLIGGPQEERYRAATVPFTCPDMPR